MQFLIGDFTGMIGDPTGKNQTRPPLTREEIKRNAETYQAQVFKILDADKTQILFNSEWSDKLGAEGMIKLAAQLHRRAPARARRLFEKVRRATSRSRVHELLYPLMQGYDSVAMKADVELGGTDQKFNLLVGRELQKQLRPGAAVHPHHAAARGARRHARRCRSRSATTSASPSRRRSMFGKLMSISDELMWRYIELLSFESPARQ